MKFKAVDSCTCTAFAAAILFLAAGSCWAVTHVVQFGGSFGFAYSPTNFSAVVGDTVHWEGDFSVHPLSSTTIPATAQSWHNGSGTSFSYAIKVTGTYHYQCDVHAGIGMVGSFEVTSSGVNSRYVPQQAGHQIQYLNVNSGNSSQPSVTFGLSHAGFVVLQVFDLLGRTVATVSKQMQGAGAHTLALGAKLSPRAFYFVKMTVDGDEIVKSLRVIAP